jgi:deoxynucleoside triphosphate triphosphohydrolase SAMHD1
MLRSQVIDEEICFKASVHSNIYELYHCRAQMHSNVYNHR